MKEVLAVGAAEELLRGSGGGDDDVGAVGLGVEIFEGDGFGVNGGAANSAAIFSARDLGAVGYEDVGGALLDEVAGG